MKVYIVKSVLECEGYLIERINKVFSNKELSQKYAEGLEIKKSIEFIEGDIYIEEYDVEDNEFEYTCQQDLSDEDREDRKDNLDVIINRLEVIQANAEDVMNWTIEEIQERSWNLRNTLEDIIIDLEEREEANKREYELDYICEIE